MCFLNKVIDLCIRRIGYDTGMQVQVCQRFQFLEGFLPATTKGTFILENTFSSSQIAAFSFSGTERLP